MDINVDSKKLPVFKRLKLLKLLKYYIWPCRSPFFLHISGFVFKSTTFCDLADPRLGTSKNDHINACGCSYGCPATKHRSMWHESFEKVRWKTLRKIISIGIDSRFHRYLAVWLVQNWHRKTYALKSHVFRWRCLHRYTCTHTHSHHTCINGSIAQLPVEST